MNPGRADGKTLIWAVAALLWGVAFSMSCQMASLAPLSGPGGDSLMGRLLGASRSAFGESSLEQADNYFHKGVGHVRQKAFSNSVFQQLGSAIAPSGHEHAEGAQAREIMPWLRFATEMDPRNVPAYLTTAFWLGTSLERNDLALEVLMEAQRTNPRDYRILFARARMAFRDDEEKSKSLLDAGIRVWPGDQDPEDEQVRVDLSGMLSYRAVLYEMDGDREKALAMFRKAGGLNPKNKGLAARVAAMERGEDFTEADRKTWQSVFRSGARVFHDDHAEHDCEREHGEQGAKLHVLGGAL